VDVAVKSKETRAGRRWLFAQAQHRPRPERHGRSHSPVAAIHQSRRNGNGCAENLHGGRLQGSLESQLDGPPTWTRWRNKTRLARAKACTGSLRHTTSASISWPGLPIMMTDEGTGSFTGHEFTVSGNHAIMVLSPSRRVQANELAFHCPPILRPKPSSTAFLKGAHDWNGGLARRSLDARNLCAARRASPSILRPSKAKRKAILSSTSSWARPRVRKTPSSTPAGALDNLQIEKFLADEKLEVSDGLVRGRSQCAEDRGRRRACSALRPMWMSSAPPAMEGSADNNFPPSTRPDAPGAASISARGLTGPLSHQAQGRL